MPTYFMNIRDGEDVAVDPEGDEYASLHDARLDAVASAKEIGADALKAGKSLEDTAMKVFEIRNEAGDLLATVPFIVAFAR